jgi:hypothetical protein
MVMGMAEMDMKEKLVELLDDIQRCGEGYTDHEIYGMRLPDTVSNEDVADHLIANGVTVLPCNVGDKIYYINIYTGKIDEDTVKFLTITKNGAKPILTYHNIKFWDFYELGKTAFLTKDEAEAALPQLPKEVE